MQPEEANLGQAAYCCGSMWTTSELYGLGSITRKPLVMSYAPVWEYIASSISNQTV